MVRSSRATNTRESATVITSIWRSGSFSAASKGIWLYFSRTWWRLMEDSDDDD